MVTNSPKNNTSAEIQTNSTEIISTEWTSVSQSPEWKKIVKKTKQETKEVKENTKTDFEKISENPKLNENLQKVIKWLGLYIDSELWKDFSKIEKDNIKVVLISYLTEKVNNIDLWIINWIKNWIDDKIKSILNSFKNEDDDDEKKVKFENFFDSLWINWIKKDLDEKITDIKNNKKDNNFKNLKNAFSSIDSVDTPEWDILDTINENLKKSSEKFDDFSKIWELIKNSAEKLWMWDILSDLLSWLKKDFPFLAWILSMLFWFETEWWDKKEKANSNLIKFIKNKEKSPLDEIEKEEKIDLKSENLKGFYSYMNLKEIDYSKKDFWQEFLTWEDKNWNNISNKKIIDLRKLTETIKLETISLSEFIENLNWLWKKEEKEQQIILDNKISKLEWKPENTTKIQKKSENNKKILISEQKRELNKLKFEKSLLNIWETKKVIYKWKEISINIVNNNLEIGWTKYKIELLATEKSNMQILENINFSWNNIDIKYTSWFLQSDIKTLNSTDFWKILKEVIDNKSYNKPIPWKPANLVITKV